MISKLWQLAGIREDEHRLALRCFLYVMLIGLVQVWLEITTKTLFLNNFPTSILALSYTASSISLIIVGAIYAALTRYFKFSQLLKLISISVGLLSFLIWVAMRLNLGSWVFFVAMSWGQLTYGFFQLLVWGMLHNLFTLDQAKRMLPTVGMSLTSAHILSSLSIPFLTQAITLDHVILVASLAMFSSTILLIAIIKKSSHRFKEGAPVKSTPVKKMEWYKQSYLIHIILFCFLSVGTFTTVDFLLNAQSKAMIKDELKLADFFGIFFAILYGVQILQQAVISKFVINRLGLKAALLSRSVLTGIVFIALLVALPFNHLTLIFLLCALMKLFDESLEQSIWRHAYLLLFYPLGAKIGSWFLSKTELIVLPAATLTASGFLWVIWKFTTTPVLYTTLLLISAAIILFFVGNRLQSGYIEELKKAIAKRRPLSLMQYLDGNWREILLTRLSRGKASEVIYCLNLLENVDKQSYEKGLEICLKSGDSFVRHETFMKLESYKLSSSIPYLEEYIHTESSPENRTSAFRAMLNQDAHAEKKLEIYLNQQEAVISDLAIEAALKTKNERLINASLEKLTVLGNSAAHSNRLRAAKILGELEDLDQSILDATYPLVAKLLNDVQPAIVMEAIKAVALFQDEVLYQKVIDLLFNREFQSSVIHVFAQANQNALPPLKKSLTSAWDQGDTEKIKLLITILGQIREKASIALLLDFLPKAEHRGLKYHFLQALDRLGYSPEQSAEIDPFLQHELQHMQLLVHFLQVFKNQDRYKLLAQAIQQELLFSQKQLFILLGFVYSRETINNIYNNLQQKEDIDKTSYAYELLENILSKKHKQTLLLVIRESFLMQPLQAGPHPLDQLKKILALPTFKITSQVKAMAIYTVYHLDLKELVHYLEKMQADKDFMVRETADWVLKKVV